MKKAVIKKNGLVLVRNTDVTSNFRERFRGLMFAQSIPDNYGLLITPCRQRHMMNMKFPLDAIYLSENGTVVHIDENMRPWTVGRTVKNAAAVLEVNAGTCARCGIAVNDILKTENLGQSEV